MSRYDIDYGGDYDGLAYGRFERAARVVMKSKRGIASLRELEQALLALPEPRLARQALLVRDTVEDRLEYPDCEPGDVCALGAVARMRGIEPDEYLNDDDVWASAEWAAQTFGYAVTFAYLIAEQNDSPRLGGQETPEQRYKEMLAWVRRKLAAAGA